MPTTGPVPDPYSIPNQTSPPPQPLVEGEHVLCTLLSNSSGPRLDAVVVALDTHYKAAANAFQHTNNYQKTTPTANHFNPQHPPHASIDLTQRGPIDLDTSHQPHHLDHNNTHGLILFREADDGKSPSASFDAPTPTKNTPHRYKKRRGQEVSPLPPAIEAFAENGHIKPSEAPAPHPIKSGRVYVHFSGRDRRLDRWVSAAELERATESALAEAASGVIANTLVDNAVQAEFAIADTAKNHAPKLTRSRRRQYEAINPVSEREVGNEAAARLEKAREEMTKVRNISSIVFGEDDVDAWYYSPYPGKFGKVEKLYICRYCLKYTRSERSYVKHCTACSWNWPPGRLIYHERRKPAVSIYEIDGQVNSDYCQRLCLLGKLFLDHKTLYFDVGPFLFYVITIDEKLAGFFSKEKPICHSDFNLACILTLPQHQRKGVGRFLISLSYELTKREGKTGSPERPLSDLGQLSYRSYWAYTITAYLCSKEGNAGISTKDIAQATGIRIADVTATLKSMNLVRIWKGEPYAETSAKALEVARKKVRKPLLPLNPSLLRINPARESIGSARPPKSKRKRPRKALEQSSDEVYEGTDSVLESTPIPLRYTSPDQHPYTHHREKGLIRHPVSTTLRTEALDAASFTHGADENGVSDIMLQDTLENGGSHEFDDDEDVLHISSDPRPSKRGRIRSRKHDEVVVIHSPSRSH